MPIITRLVQGKKNPNRVNLYLDDSFAFALSLDEVAKNGLKKGLELTQAQIDNLKNTDESEYLYAKILNFLSYRPRTVKEVRDRLYKYEVKDETQQNFYIEKLRSRGYLDDVAFAQWFVTSRAQNRPRSLRHLMLELTSHGISRDIVSQVLQGLDDAQALRDQISKKSSLPKEKLLAYLMRRGFSYDHIKAQLDEMGISE